MTFHKKLVFFAGVSLAVAFLPSCSKSSMVTQGSLQNGTNQVSWTWAPNISFSSLTQNNSAASSSWNQTQTIKYDSGKFAGQTKTVNGFWDQAVGPSSQPTSNYGMISKVPVSTLLPGYNVPVIVETQNWWGHGNGHINNGEDSQSIVQIKNQLADHVSRGFAGQVIDWYGPGQTSDVAAQNIMANVADYQYGSVPYKFALMLDKGYFSNVCGDTIDCLNKALSYMTKYFSSPYYMKDSAGHPLVYTFINSFYPNEYNLFFGTDGKGGGINYQNAKFVFYEPNGFSSSPPQTIGEYDWANPEDNQAYIDVIGSLGSFWIDPYFGFKDLLDFYTNAEENQSGATSYIVGAAFKGFNDFLANWSGGRIIDQQCGQTWLNTFDSSGKYGYSGSLGALNYLKLGYKMNYLMVDTWDDYEEGTEIETGIDNCLSGISVSVSGNTLTWTPSWGSDPMNNAIVGSESSLYKYDIYVAASIGGPVQYLTSCYVGACTRSLDLTKFAISGGPYYFYVQAVGMPSVKNTLSSASNAWTPTANLVVNISKPTNGGSVTSPTHLVGSASGGTIDALQIYLDNTLYSSFSASSVNAPIYLAGAHTLTLKAWSGSKSKSASVSVTSTCNANQLNMPMPVSGSIFTAGTSVQINAAACTPAANNGISAIEIYDGTTQLSVQSNFTGLGAFVKFSTSTLVKGTHSLWLKAWDNKGHYFDTSANKTTIKIQ